MSMQFRWVDKTNYNSSFCGEGNETDTVIRCDIDFVSVFAVPGFLLLATYIYGIYLFWDTQEYLENLAGQVHTSICLSHVILFVYLHI